LGKDSIEKGMRAIAYGVLLIVVFMLIYYRTSGLIADVALAINLLFVVACLGMLNATLTLPGIAGILVSIGMAVDANIIIFERIREELRTGRPVKAAIELGYERAHETILDANLTTIITGIILFYFGTGPIKGFAVTLIFGLIANYITAIWFTRLAYEWMITRGKNNTLSI
jgi:protein-export membrane protein SecD